MRPRNLARAWRGWYAFVREFRRAWAMDAFWAARARGRR